MQSLDYKQDRKRIKLRKRPRYITYIKSLEKEKVLSTRMRVNWCNVFQENTETADKLYYGLQHIGGLNRIFEWTSILHHYKDCGTISFRPGTMFNEKMEFFLKDDVLTCYNIKNKKEALEAVWFLNRYFFQFREYNLLLLSTKNLNTDICKTIKLFLI